MNINVVLENKHFTLKYYGFTNSEIEKTLISLYKKYKSLKYIEFIDFEFNDLQLTKFNLLNINFVNCTFNNCEFYESDISNCNFNNCIINDGLFVHHKQCEKEYKYSLFYKVKFNNSLFHRITLKNIKFDRCSFEKTEFNSCYLYDCIFYCGNFINSKTTYLQFSSVYFKACNFNNQKMMNVLDFGLHFTLCEGIIDAGLSNRGYRFLACIDENNVMNIFAGCRHFVGVKEAIKHWKDEHKDNIMYREDCLIRVKLLSHMAKLNNWKV